MTGFHEIGVFAFPLPLGGEPLDLPKAWEPFSSTIESNRLVVVCRRFHEYPRPVKAGYSHPDIFTPNVIYPTGGL